MRFLLDLLQVEFDFYLENKDVFHQQYEGKFIVLKNKVVIGVYTDRMEAINETRKTNELGTFLVQHVVDSEEQIRFHSRFSL